MSHFTVMVIGDEPEKQLAPYQENNMGSCPEEFLSFFDKTEELTKDWEEENQETKDKYPTLKEYAEEYCGYKFEEKTGKYGYWENKNAKWDWYQLGGRWTGLLKLKANAEHAVLGTPSFFNTEEIEEGYADQALKSEINFEGMRNERAQKAAEIYDKVYSVIKDHIDNFKTFDQLKASYSDESIDNIREKYHNQDLLKAWNEKREEYDLPFFFEEEDFINKSREDYILDERNCAATTFALLKDGKWYEKGEMGWWAIVKNEKEQENWNKEFAKLIDEVPDNTLISIYDCHI